MAIESTPRLIRVHTPSITKLPITSTSQPVILEPYHVDLLPSYDYVTREYLISGIAAGAPYCTRLLLRCPAESSRFSGVVVEEPAHIWSGTSIWRATNRWLMRNGKRTTSTFPSLGLHVRVVALSRILGHAWIEVDSQAPVAVGIVKESDPIRYAAMTFPPGPVARDFQETIPFTPDPTRQKLEDEYTAFMQRWWAATPQSPEILAATSHALRSGQLGLSATRVFLSGLSQTGGVTRRFITHSSHLRLPDGSVPFEGYIPCASGGVALPDLGSGVKIIELLGEAEFQSVRWACGVSGQARGLSHRRGDSGSFRLYEVAGMAHRESRYSSGIDTKRFSVCDLAGAQWSTFPNSFIYAAVFEMMVRWTEPGDDSVAPPPSAFLSTIGETDEVLRDEHGNAVGGVRSLHLDVPISRVVAATPMGRPSWYRGESTQRRVQANVIDKSVGVDVGVGIDVKR
jgi:hypothetical protein